MTITVSQQKGKKALLTVGRKKRQKKRHPRGSNKNRALLKKGKKKILLND
jgi:hypothetical protein